ARSRAAGRGSQEFPCVGASRAAGVSTVMERNGVNVTADAATANIDSLGIARDLILRPSGLDDGRLDRVFGEVLSHSVDFADLYFQLSHEEAWSLEDGIVKDGSASIEQGVGVRALAGEKTGFAYSDEIVLPALEEASRAARAIAVQGGDKQVRAWQS